MKLDFIFVCFVDYYPREAIQCNHSNDFGREVTLDFCVSICYVLVVLVFLKNAVVCGCDLSDFSDLILDATLLCLYWHPSSVRSSSLLLVFVHHYYYYCYIITASMSSF